MRSDQQRRTGRALVRSPGVAVLAILTFGAAYVRVAESRDRNRIVRVGQAFAIGGRSLNLFCSGSGEPSVIFESGYGFPGYSWNEVQPKVAKFTRACWYDRAGNGWSDAAPGPRFSDSVARDLHTLLNAAKVPVPYVIVGHSLGGFHARVFNARYPRDVAGLVLVDPSNEDVATKIPDMPRSRPPRIPAVIVRTVDEVLRQVGAYRFLTRDLGPRPDGVSSADWDIISSLRHTMKAQRAAANEAPESGSADIARAAGGLDGTQLIVLTRGKPFPFADTAFGTHLLTEWIELSGQLAAKSVHGRQVVVPGSGHFIQFDRPDAVVAAVRDLVDSSRARAAYAAHGR